MRGKSATRLSAWSKFHAQPYPAGLTFARRTPRVESAARYRARVSTIAFFPESAYGPTNNCVGIGDVLRRRGHRVVFIAEESFAGALEAQGFEERLMRLTPPPETEEEPGQFWKDFIRETAPVFRKPTIEQLGEFIAPTFQRSSTARSTSTTGCARSSTTSART